MITHLLQHAYTHAHTKCVREGEERVEMRGWIVHTECVREREREERVEMRGWIVHTECVREREKREVEMRGAGL